MEFGSTRTPWPDGWPGNTGPGTGWNGENIVAVVCGRLSIQHVIAEIRPGQRHEDDLDGLAGAGFGIDEFGHGAGQQHLVPASTPDRLPGDTTVASLRPSNSLSATVVPDRTSGAGSIRPRTVLSHRR